MNADASASRLRWRPPGWHAAKRRFPRMYRFWLLVRVVLRQSAAAEFRRAWKSVREYVMGAEYEVVYRAARSAFARTRAARAYVIDVGASTGVFVGTLSRFIPLAGATCYEPLPDTWPARRADLINVRFRDVAVGSRPGTVEISRANHPGLSSVLKLSSSYKYQFDGFDEIRMIESRTVELVTLDHDFAAADANGELIVLKIDTQGYELEVLKGATSLLRSDRVAVVVLELMVKEKYDGQGSIDEVIRFLRDLGYEIYDIARGCREVTGQVSEYDFVFCHNKYLADGEKGP